MLMNGGSEIGFEYHNTAGKDEGSRIVNMYLAYIFVSIVANTFDELYLYSTQSVAANNCMWRSGNF